MLRCFLNAPTADGGKSRIQFFPTKPSPLLALSSPVADFAKTLPYTTIYSISDHQNSTAVSLTKDTFSTDISIVKLQHLDLLSGHNRLLSHIRRTFKECETLRHENSILRIANRRLKDRMNLIVRAYLQKYYASMMSSGSPPPSTDPGTDPISLCIEKFGYLRIGETNIGAADSSESCESLMTSVLDLNYSPTACSESSVSPTSVLDLISSPTDSSESCESSTTSVLDLISSPMEKSKDVRPNEFLKEGQAGATPAGTISVPPKREANQARSVVPAYCPQEVYVHGKNKKGKPIELEVYNQGTSKREFCFDKRQETGTRPYGKKRAGDRKLVAPLKQD